MKKAYGFLIPLFYVATAVHADSLTLQDCQRMARQNYPNLSNAGRNEQIYLLNKEKINAAWYPQVALNGQAAYQSDVFELPFTPQGMEIVDLPHERYQGTLDISQSIYDGGATRARKNTEQERLIANQQDLAIELHQLEMNINEVFFGILLAQKNDSILQQTLNLLIEKSLSIEAALEGGAVSTADALRIETEILKVRQQVDENNQKLRSMKSTLGILTGTGVENMTLVMPSSPGLPAGDEPINRPELKALTARMRELDAQSQATATELRPRVAAFFSGGVGDPNPYNFYDVDFSSFYTIGLRLSWKFFDWKTSAYDRQVLQLKADMLSGSRQNMERNILLRLNEVREQVRMYDNLIEKDRQIISVRERIRELSSLQLDEGIIASTQYLEDVNAEKTARLNHEIHRIQLLKTTFNYLTEIGMESRTDK